MNCECNLCGSRNQKVVFDNNQLRVVKCRKCDLVFQCPQVFQDTKDYYTSRPTEIEEPDIFRKRRTNFILTRLTDFHPNAVSLLDVGCGWGHFLQNAKRKFKNVEGVEPNNHQARYLVNNDLKVHQEVYHRRLFDKSSFDIISFIQVMEHVPDPKGTINTCYQHLNKDGILVIDVPSYNNPRFLLYRLTGNKSIVSNDFIAPHLFYYTPKTLKLLCRKAGFDILHSDIGQYSVKLGLDHSIIGSAIDRISKYLNIGSITIYAKK